MIDFHDSNLIDIKINEKELLLTISIDTHWFPGKKIGILKLIDCGDFDKFYKAWENET